MPPQSSGGALSPPLCMRASCDVAGADPMRGPSPGVAPSPHSACLAQFFRSLAGSNMNVMINDIGEDHVPAESEL